MKYICDAVFIEECYYWAVYEVGTEQVVKIFFFEDGAKEYLDFLERGGAFDGYTPGFMLQQIQLPREPVNEAFSRVFS